MTDKHTQELSKQGNMEKDPADWVTGDEPMTGAQRSYLKTLSEEAKQPFDESLNKAEASRRIDELQAMTGRGKGAGAARDADDESEETAPGQRPPAPRGTPADDEAPMKSLGEAIIEPILGADKDALAHGRKPDKAD